MEVRKSYDINSDNSISEFMNFIYGDNYMSDDNKRKIIIEQVRRSGGIYVNTDNSGTYVLVHPNTNVVKVDDNKFRVLE